MGLFGNSTRKRKAALWDSVREVRHEVNAITVAGQCASDVSAFKRDAGSQLNQAVEALEDENLDKATRHLCRAKSSLGTARHYVTIGARS